ncbi:hypothetical protein [Deinococcus humi]|uniref:Uncharacterized protein n=1 Tax=Deinococcus humi TaxID=662880 RepID=A0A7W8JTX1_9DEIO|nr:hypothetical protein [Deinococcus humi]MBB5363094.1 hypothetical protein [Deinococcus humi]GGO24713.1 hypothetical protein GCM10008949_13920 [Deinococcus humi]
MELVARDATGETLAHACGCTQEHPGAAVVVGLLYVRPGVETREHLFEHPQSKKTWHLRLPIEALNLPTAGQGINVNLEIP